MKASSEIEDVGFDSWVSSPNSSRPTPFSILVLALGLMHPAAQNSRFVGSLPCSYCLMMLQPHPVK